MAEIKRLGTKKVILLGGEKALSKQVVLDIQNAGLSTPERIFGYDQFETAQKVAERVGSKGQVILASGEQYPDALSISAYAGATETPILLTKAKTMPLSTQQELNDLQQKGALHTIIVGGEAVVSGATLGSLNSVPQRLFGNDQYDTAAAIFSFARSVLTSQTAYLVTGENFPDALAVGSLAAKQNAGIVMTQRPCLPASTYALLSTASLLKVVIVGGSVVVPDHIKQILEGTAPNKPPGLLGGEIIVVDPGHGTPDPGAVGPAGTKEKDGNLAMAQKLATLLRAAGAQVYLTRTGDASPASSDYNQHNDLWSRVDFANSVNATLFVSIHTNAGAALAHGTETYYGMYPDFDNSSESYKLAKSIQDNLVNTIGLTDRGVKMGDYTVLNHFKMPAVLVEVVFIANSYEEQLIASDSFRQKAATGIFKGILAYKGI